MDARENVIVCGIDGSPAGQRALDWALDEARRRQCRLRAVSVWSWDGLETGSAMRNPGEAREHAEQVLDRCLNAATNPLSETPEIERVVAEGRPSEQLCTAALDAELLVLGSHGHGAIHDVLVGSTSQHVIRHAPCPVVVLPDPRHVEREYKRAQEHRRHRGTPEGAGPMF